MQNGITVEDKVKGSMNEMKLELDKCRKALVEKEKRISKLMVEVTTKDEEIEVLKQSTESTESNKVGGWVECNICEVEVRSKQKLKNHMSKVHNILCGNCDNRFETNDQLSEHVKKSHHQRKQKEQNTYYLCEFNCGKSFKSQQEVNKHNDDDRCIDQDDNRVGCERCEYIAPNEDDLRKHIETNHKRPVQPNRSNRSHNATYNACRNGNNCQFLRQNRCKFYHAVAEQPDRDWQLVNRRNSHHVRHGAQPTRENTAGVQWCKFSDRCNRGRFCRFRHYELDFPQRVSQRRQ